MKEGRATHPQEPPSPLPCTPKPGPDLFIGPSFLDAIEPAHTTRSSASCRVTCRIFSSKDLPSGVGPPGHSALVSLQKPVLANPQHQARGKYYTRTRVTARRALAGLQSSFAKNR